jgi:predicted nucleic acid-binding protein
MYRTAPAPSDAVIDVLAGSYAMLWIPAFLRKYRKLNPQIADAALMYLADRENIDTIFTLDRRDFSIFQLSGGRRVHILPKG